MEENTIMKNPFDFENTPLFDTLKKLREISERYESSPTFVALKEFQDKLNTVREPIDGALEATKAFQEVFKAYDYSNSLAIKNMLSISQNISAAAVSASNAMHLHSAIDVLQNLDFSALTSIEATSHIMDSIPSDITFDTVSELIENGEITDDDLQAEIKSTITGTENEAAKGKPSIIQKALKFIAKTFIIFLIATLFFPVTDTVQNEIVEALRIDEFWQNTGIIDWIESWSEIGRAATEDEAKATVDERKTGNISKQKREDLLNKIEEIRKYISNAPQDENTGNLLSYLSEIEKDVNGKKYGLIFEEHREDIDEVLDTYTPVLTEETDLFIDNGGQMNFLIEGDNLASLKILEKTHKGKIDLIYIDPPYNTLNSGFTYSDTYVDVKDTFRHSKWLSFMEQRLTLAKKLMSSKGSIFISIDDNEVGSLRLLCDSIFGANNFIANVIWEKKFSPQNDAKWLSDSHDHILVYSKDKENWRPNLMSRSSEMDSRYKNPDNDPRGVWTSGDLSVKTYSSATDYPITTPSGRIVNPPSGYCWRYSKEKFNEMVADNRIWFGKSGNNVPRIKRFLTDVQQGTVCKTIWYRTEVGDTQEGTKNLKAVFDGKGVFTNPKPVRLIERILDLATNADSIVLDFFAGSGTTGQAVIRYFSEQDNKNLRFILCTNNENNICRDVTYERIKRVIEKENYNASLKYYKVEYVPITERMYYEYADELLKHIRELVELENGINFIGNAEIAIVLTDEELSEFTSNIEQYSACKKLYMGHDLLPDEEQERIIKENDIEISIIPDYYYKDLQEK